ncbi:hypothetical protein MKX01_040033 [Papaver californicum]|nr:hypothetical protein MKX01_040033 [Papaver californicum]
MMTGSLQIHFSWSLLLDTSLSSGKAVENHSFWFSENITPLVSITENIRSELLASFANMRTAMDLGEAGVAMKTTFVARFGTILLHNPSANISSSRPEAATTLARVRKQFCTKLTDPYMKTILGGVFLNIIADFYQPKEYYRVNVSDKLEPESGISIKCKIICGKLKIQKIEKNQKRCFVPP